MKILHLCLCGPVIDNWNYQDNLLSKYHKKLGNSVTIITSQWVRDDKGKKIKTKKTDYFNDDGVKMIRLPYKEKGMLRKKFKRFEELYQTIENCNPDLIFIHGCQFADINYVIKYLNNKPETIVYLDNHADFNNSGTNWISKNILHKVIWRTAAKKIEPFVRKFYGVSPARVDFLIDVYKIPEEKVELLLMGADDELIDEVKNINKNDLRHKYKLNSDDFLIITGGKINNYKTQVLLLMKAIKKLNNPNIKLMIFGSVDSEYRDTFNELLSENIIFIGWIDSKDTYQYIDASDLVVFPGLHSVLWEQAVGLGKPCVFKYIEGFTHIDVGGNCKFLYDDSVEEMKNVINDIYKSPEQYGKMVDAASEEGMKRFSYKNIAKQSISF